MRLIDADALIGALHNTAFLEGDDRSICYGIIQRQPTIETEQALYMAIEALKAREWIPVSKKPEPKEKTYLIQTDGGYVCSCRWTNVNHFWTDLTTDWHWHIMDVPQYSKVIAWMTLPEPYKAESEDKE